MKFHQRIGAIFATFSALSLVTNIFLTANPDRAMNLIETSVLTVAFALSALCRRKLAGWLQVGTLAVAAFIPMSLSSSPFFGAVIAVFALVLIHAYDGFRTHPFWKLPSTFFSLLFLCAMASSHFDAPSAEQWARAMMWSLFILLFCAVLWLVADEHERRVQEEMVKHNRALIEENRTLIARCKDDAD